MTAQSHDISQALKNPNRTTAENKVSQKDRILFQPSTGENKDEAQLVDRVLFLGNLKFFKAVV